MRIRNCLDIFVVAILLAGPLYSQVDDDKGEPGVIIGTVADLNDRPLPNARVCIQEFGMPTIGTLECVVSDRDGRFRFGKIRLSKFKVTAVSDETSGGLTPHLAVMVRLTQQNPTKHLKIRLEPPTGHPERGGSTKN